MEDAVEYLRSDKAVPGPNIISGWVYAVETEKVRQVL